MPGMRVGTDIIIYFDTKAIFDAGIELRQSAGCAVLTEQHVPADTIISVRARENGAVKNVNLDMVEKCSEAQKKVVIGNDHEATIESGKKWGAVLARQEEQHTKLTPPPPPTWTKEEEDEARKARQFRPQPQSQKRSLSPEINRDDLDTLPSYHDDLDWVDWGSDSDANERIKESRSKPDAYVSPKPKKAPRSTENEKPDVKTSRKNSPREDVVQPKDEPATDKKHRETDAEKPRGETHARKIFILKERKSQSGKSTCHECGSTKQRGNTQCTACDCALKREAVEVNQKNVDVILTAAKCFRKWIDRGIRSSGADMRIDYRKRVRRAERLGYKNIRDRFHKDEWFRSEMIIQGWSADNVGDIDEIAKLPPLENTGRSAFEQWKHQGWYDRHLEDPKGKPAASLWLAPTHIISNLRRRQETHLWKSKTNQDWSRWETSANDGMVNHTMQTKGKSKDKRPNHDSSDPGGYSAFYHLKGRHTNGKSWAESKGNSKGKSSSSKEGKGKPSSHWSEKGNKGKGK